MEKKEKKRKKEEGEKLLYKMNAFSIGDYYTFGRKLGAGAFGVTTMCAEILTGQEYACKIISKQNLTSRKDQANLEREIQILE